MRRPARLAAVLLVIAAGCGSFSSSGDPTPADAGADGVAPVEAGPPVPDGAPPDGAASDAGSGFCNVEGPKHDFCADFDTVNDVTDGWLPEVQGPSVAPMFASLSSSPPRSMSVAVRRDDAGATVPISRLSYQAPFPTGTVGVPETRVQFALYVENADEAGRNAFITSIELGEPLSLVLRKLSDSSCEVLVTQGANVLQPSPSLTLPIRRWTRVKLIIPARSGTGPSGGGVTVGVDTELRTVTVPAVAHPASFRADIGLAFSNPLGGDWAAYFDDVLIDGAKRTQ